MSEHKNHITPLWVYFGVGAALFVLTIVTVGASFIDFNHLTGLSSMNLIVAMLIATIKASLVALFFMHLFFDDKIYTLALLAGLTTLTIFIVLTIFDTNHRGDLEAELGKPIVPQVEYKAPSTSDHH